MSTIYHVLFDKFDKLEDLLIFAEYEYGDEDLKR